MHKENNLYGFFIDCLKDMMYIENYLPAACRSLAGKARATALTDAILLYAGWWQNQGEKLNEIFRLLGEQPDERRCEAVKCIMREARQLADETDTDSQTRDAALIMAIRKAGYYKIGSYESIIYLAELLENPKIAAMLASALHTEQEIQQQLKAVAMESINSGILSEG